LFWESIGKLSASVALAAWASSVTAQENDWELTASLYLFTPKTTTQIGALDSTLTFKDALENLDLAFMGAFEASNGRWGLLADYMLTDLSFRNETPDPAYSGLNTELKTQILSGYVAYRVYQDQKTTVDLAGGFRWFDISSSLTLLPGSSPGMARSVNESWIDPVVGARVRYQFSQKWSGTVFADYGGDNSGSKTWQALATANYQINEKWAARFGYRQISFDHKIDGTPFSYDQSGPVFGVAYRF
jgi:hypothetical protein